MRASVIDDIERKFAVLGGSDVDAFSMKFRLIRLAGTAAEQLLILPILVLRHGVERFYGFSIGVYQIQMAYRNPRPNLPATDNPMCLWQLDDVLRIGYPADKFRLLIRRTRYRSASSCFRARETRDEQKGQQLAQP